jgi:hypothetical protein
MKFVLIAYGFTILAISGLFFFCLREFLKIKIKLSDLEKNETQKRKDQESPAVDL